VFSVNKTIHGIFDAVLNHRVVVKWGSEYVGNPILVDIVLNSSKMFEAKATIGSAEMSILEAKELTYIIGPDFDKAEKLLEDSLNYFEAKEYNNAITSTQQVKNITMNSFTLTMGGLIKIFLVVAIVTVITIIVYRKRRYHH